MNKKILFLNMLIMFTGQYAQAAEDPTQPDASTTTPPPSSSNSEKASVALNLQSIITSSGRKLAMINGETYKIGQKVGNLTLQSIATSHVVLRDENNIIKTLVLYPSTTKNQGDTPIKGATTGTENIK